MRKILIILAVTFFVMCVGGTIILFDSVQAAVKDIYYCPMHPSYISDHPGTCPICNMNLVKKDNAAGFADISKEDALHATIKLDAQKRQLIGVKIAPVENKEVFRTIRTYGKVARDSRWIYAQVFEYERPFLYSDEHPLVGLQHPVIVEIPALPGKVFHGKVRLLEREIDPVTRTTLVRIALDDWNRALKPDMSATVNIKIDLGMSLTVAQSAVIDTGVRQIVFVDRGQGLIEPRTVILGEKGDEDYQVVSGLQQGENVIVSGNFLIDSESRLKAVLENVSLQDDGVSTGEHRHGQ